MCYDFCRRPCVEIFGGAAATAGKVVKDDWDGNERYDPLGDVVLLFYEVDFIF